MASRWAWAAVILVGGIGATAAVLASTGVRIPMLGGPSEAAPSAVEVVTASAEPDPVAEPPASEPSATTKKTGPESPCPPEMALIQQKFCVDKWEASLVDEDGEPHSPYHRVRLKKVKAVSRPGVVPQAYINHDQANAACKRSGKRLCSSTQWTQACGGSGRYPRALPYGDKLKKKACNINSPMHPTAKLYNENRHDSKSLNDPKLNQVPGTVAKTGEFSECVTPEGVADMHGNLLEWARSDKSRPYLLGGYYLDGIKHGNGCYYVTDGHDSNYHDFTTGFRCCLSPEPAKLAAYVAQVTPPPEPKKREPRPDGQIPRDPEGMRGFFDPRGKLPDVQPLPYQPAGAACPVDMVHVKGLRCSKPVQRCLEWLPPERRHRKKISCKEFAKPVECKGSRAAMDYCIDRYEFTADGYDYPLTSVNWREAENLCAKMDKQLCREREWEFACEGPEALPYPYGYVRDGKKCNHDLPEIELVTSPDNFIDHRVKADALPGCVSPFGVYNMVGNVDEWTTRDGGGSQRAILRSGWWLRGRNRCRAATANHGENYGSMQTGFRCCKPSRKK